MRLKYKVNINRSKSHIILLSLILAGFGLMSPIIFKSWLPPDKENLSFLTLFVSATVGFVIGKFAHEIYRLFIVNLLGVRTYFILLPSPRIFFMDTLGKWQAIGIALAPFTDLTLIGLICLAFVSWGFIPATVTFLTVNLILSARDLIESYYLIRFVGPGEVVQKMHYGFDVWG